MSGRSGSNNAGVPAALAPGGGSGSLGATLVAGWRESLGRLASGSADRDRLDLIAELERLKAAAAAVQARMAAAMAAEQVGRANGREAQASAVRSVAGQVGLARRTSQSRAQSLVGMARALCADLPCTLAALSAGEISEWQAMLVVRETAALSGADRAAVDVRLAGGLGRLGDRALAREACRLVDLVDPQAVARRVKRAEADRRVTVTPAPGPAGCAMARLTATMPVAEAVGAYAALRKHAESLRARGEARGIGQLMSDELFARLTGAGGSTRAIDVEVGLVMSERTLLRGGKDPAVLTDDQGNAFAHVPAVLARTLVSRADRAWLSRLYAAPESGELVAMDSRRRTFTGRLRRLVLWRDQTCRMPWCEAPIRHADHVRDHAARGPTGLANAAGLCASCNYLKEAPGWRAEVVTSRGHCVEITTPTGHRYRSNPPPAPGHQEQTLDERVERSLDDWSDGMSGAA